MRVNLVFVQDVEPALANLLNYCTNFQCCKWPNIEKMSNHTGHTGWYFRRSTKGE